LILPLKGSDHKSKFLLTHREREVFELLVQDKTTKDIAQLLFISEKTVRNHISNVMQKLNVKGRSQAVVELIKLGELKI
jgi:LuxR family transcriptional regulator of spore coat protein